LSFPFAALGRGAYSTAGGSTPKCKDQGEVTWLRIGYRADSTGLTGRSDKSDPVARSF